MEIAGANDPEAAVETERITVREQVRRHRAYVWPVQRLFDEFLKLDSNQRDEFLALVQRGEARNALSQPTEPPAPNTDAAEHEAASAASGSAASQGSARLGGDLEFWREPWLMSPTMTETLVAALRNGKAASQKARRAA